MSAAFPKIPPRHRSVYEVRRPNLGLYFDRHPLDIHDRAVSGGKNFRIKNGTMTNINIGYKEFDDTNLGNQVLLIDSFINTLGIAFSIWGTKRDLFKYNEVGTPKVTYLNHIYATGTASAEQGETTVTGASTPAWNTNVKAGDFISITGDAAENLLTATWYEVDSVTDATHLELTSNFLEADTGAIAYTIRKTFTMTDGEAWDTAVFPDAPLGSTSGLAAGDHWFATNGQEIVVWDGVAATVALLATGTLGLAFTCKTLHYYKNMMLFGNITESGTSKPAVGKNSAIADPENVTTLEAGEFIAAEGIDFISNMLPLGDFLVVYAENSISIAQFVGAPLNFLVRTIAPGIGLFGPRMVMDFGDYHKFLSADQAYRFDGVRLTPFGGHVFQKLLSEADVSRASKGIVVISEEELEVYWMLPHSTDGGDDNESVKQCYTEHYAEDVGNAPTPFSHREVDVTAAGFFLDQSAAVKAFDSPEFALKGFDELAFRFNDRFFTKAFPKVLFGSKDGKVYEINTVTSFPGETDLTSYIDSPMRALAPNGTKGIIRRIEPFFELIQGAGWDVWVAAQLFERPGGLGSYGPVELYSIDQSGSRFTSHRDIGRYANIRFASRRAGYLWTISGYNVTVDEAGER